MPHVSTRAAFFKRLLQNARRERGSRELKNPDSTRLVERTRGEPAEGEGDLVFGPFPYAHNAA